MSKSNSLPMTNPDPDRVSKQIDYFAKLAAEGKDLHGEARLVDVLVPRNAHILDAGCGFGRVGGRLHELGHRVVGIDQDPDMIEAAKSENPGPNWLLGDLANFDFSAHFDERFDAIVCVGNTMVFVKPDQRRDVLNNLAGQLKPEGRFVAAFGDHRGYDFGEFIVDAEQSGFRLQLGLESFDLKPFDEDSDFMVAVFGTK